jgi:hypothetical protein
MEYIIGFVVGLVGGFALRHWMLLITIRRVMTAYNNALIQRVEDIKDTMVDVVIEREGDMFFVYNRDTNEFLAQGKTTEEIQQVLEERFPNLTFFSSVENMKQVGYKHESF